LPPERGDLLIEVFYPDPLLPVDSDHEIEVSLFTDPTNEGRGCPLMQVSVTEVPATIALAEFPAGRYTIWAFHDEGGDGYQQPCPAQVAYNVPVEPGSPTGVELRLHATMRRYRLISVAPLPLPETPRANREAEDMALALSGELIAPEELYHRVRLDLASIRAAHGDSIAELQEIYFSHRLASSFGRPWSGFCILELTTEARDQIRAGAFHCLDDLNDQLGLAYLDTFPFPWEPEVFLFFWGRLNPLRIGQVYLDQPCVTGSSLPSIVGDGPDLYPHQDGERVSYLFRNAWGDCPSGCIHNEFWYFRCQAGRCEYVGTWVFGQEPPPGWWDEACQAVPRFCLQ